MDENRKNVLALGSLLRNTYRINKHLASGGFGNTYEAMNVEFDERVAIKEFFIKDTMERDETTSAVSVSRADQYATFTEQKKKFKKEARFLRKFHNDHIIRVHDLFEENGTAYYVMDFIDGEDLSKHMMRTGKPLTDKEIMDILPQVLDALKCVHDAGLWHLDMKPSNIMMDKKGNIKLIDFGASKQLDVQKGGAVATSNVASTDRYAPLEQAEKSYDKIGPWTDIYSLGATLYSLLTKSMPPSASDINDDADEAFVKLNGVNKMLRNLIIWMMNTNRKKRPQSIDEVINYVSLNLNGGKQTEKVQTSSKQTTSYTESYTEGSTQFSSAQPTGEETVVNTNNSKRKEATEKTKLQEEYNQYYSGKTVADSDNYVADYDDDDDNKKKIFVIAAGVFVAIIIVFFSFRDCGNQATGNNDEFALDTIDTVAVDTLESENLKSYHIENYNTALGRCNYTGEVNEDLIPHGEGEATFTDGRYYKGQFKNGIMDGKAFFKYPNGDTFNGTFSDNKFYYGTYTQKSNGNYFVGHFKNGKPSGGKLYDKKGNMIEQI